mmetsp:Transcript_14146/g.25347  ORF Transcript_14146/g.25347 Transcript_14146/m.25347 type:complete len:215 (-) Transcript_14146:29-673(-)
MLSDRPRPDITLRNYGEEKRTLCKWIPIWNLHLIGIPNTNKKYERPRVIPRRYYQRIHRDFQNSVPTKEEMLVQDCVLANSPKTKLKMESSVSTSMDRRTVPTKNPLKLRSSRRDSFLHTPPFYETFRSIRTFRGVLWEKKSPCPYGRGRPGGAFTHRENPSLPINTGPVDWDCPSFGNRSVGIRDDPVSTPNCKNTSFEGSVIWWDIPTRRPN